MSRKSAYRAAHFSFLALIIVLPLLAIAQERQAPGAAGIPQDGSSGPAQGSDSLAPAKSCANRSQALLFEDFKDGESRQVPIWRLGDSPAFFFSAGMTIDADGAPNAYNSDNTGLDDLANAGQPGRWDGIIADQNGDPLVQGPDDPFPGYYVSCTSLTDHNKKRFDPTRYVDASKIPYVVLPGGLARDAGARLGDLAVVLNLRDGKYSYAIFADVGTLGEGSIALADNLGIWSNARQGGRRAGLFYLVFPGSGNGQPRTVEEINEEAEKAFQAWGGPEQINSCSRNDDPALASSPAVKTTANQSAPALAN